MFKLLIVFSLFLMSRSQPLEKNGTSGATITGEKLVKLGRQLHKPILTLIGMAIRNLHPCLEWTQWSPCTARPGFFGRISRSRTCDHNHNASELKTTTETDDKLCEGFCPVSYNITTHGYCIKLSPLEVSHKDAEKQCQLDGGHLINIESQQKHEDVTEILQGYSFHVRVGGRRKDVSSPWKNVYGVQTGFIIWNSGQPNNGSNELCLWLNPVSKLFGDGSCEIKRPFICEIVVD